MALDSPHIEQVLGLATDIQNSDRSIKQSQTEEKSYTVKALVRLL
jgi:hypothetical protein